MSRKTALYIRTALDGSSAVAEQEKRLRAFAEEHGCTEIACYSDSGVEGNTLDRPALNRLTADIKAGEIAEVLVANISRISRNQLQYEVWRNLIDKYGATLIEIESGEIAPINCLSYKIIGDCLMPAVADSVAHQSHPPRACSPRCGEYRIHRRRRHGHDSAKQ
jgi:DNA invertase Pin-like site-specific DNA recombinase